MDEKNTRSPRADKKVTEEEKRHRRKGVPLKSLRPLTQSNAAVPADAPANAADDDVSPNAETSVDSGRGSAPLPPPPEDSGVLFRVPGGVRRRKPTCPVKAL